MIRMQGRFLQMREFVATGLISITIAPSLAALSFERARRATQTFRTTQKKWDNGLQYINET